jgi:hypothetical protein
MPIAQNSSDQVLQAIARSPTFVKHLGLISNPILIRGVCCNSMKNVIDAETQNLYASCDGRGLAECKLVPPLYQFVGSGTAFQTGGRFIDAIKVRYNTLSTAARRSRYLKKTSGGGKHGLCDKGCRAAESLNHISQECWAAWPLRIKRHDHLNEVLVRELKRQHYRVERERCIPTIGGTRKPDIIASKGKVTWVIDSQVVSDSSFGTTVLSTAHAKKVKWYDVPCIREFCRKEHGAETVEFTSLTYNWRGAMASESMVSARALKVPMALLQNLAVRILECTADMFRLFHRTSGGLRYEKRKPEARLIQ